MEPAGVNAFPCVKGNPGPENALDGCRPTSDVAPAPTRVGSKWNECHEANHLLSSHHLHRPSNDMGLRDFLSLPKGHRRSRSKARSEIGPIEGQSEAELVAHQRPTTPDLGIGSSTPPTSGPLTSRGQESNRTQRTLSRRSIYLTTLFSPNTGRSISDRVRSVFSKSKPLASSTAKLLLRGVKESADAFPPLKSVAGGLCFILDNCEVRPTSRTSPDLRCLRSA